MAEDTTIGQVEDTGADPVSAEELDRPVTLKVDGAEVTVPLSEAIARAQKVSAADSRLAEATKLLEENRHKVGLGELALKMKAGDQDALRQFMTSGMGYQQEAVDEYLKTVQAAMSGDDTPAPGAQAKGASLSPEAEQTLQSAKAFFDTAARFGVDPSQLMSLLGNNLQTQGQNVLKDQIKSAVDKDEVLATMSQQGSDPSAVADFVETMLKKRLYETGREYSPEALREAVTLARTLLPKVAGKNQDPFHSLGDLGRAFVPVKDHFSATPKNVPAPTDGEAFEKYVMNRLVYHATHADKD